LITAKRFVARLRTWANGNRATGTVPFGEGRDLQLTLLLVKAGASMDREPHRVYWRAPYLILFFEVLVVGVGHGVVFLDSAPRRL
jgi:hypothetical protein